jgi:hypothetical protein
MYQNVPFLNHFFALLDFVGRSEERRAKDEGQGDAEDGKRKAEEERDGKPATGDW